MKKNKLIIISVIIMLLLITLIVCIMHNNKNTTLYSTNEQGRFRNPNEIFEEQFDNFGNLLHYKYKFQLEDGSFQEKEYNLNYTFDKDNKITEVVDNYGNYIKIKYDNAKRFLELSNLIAVSKDNTILYKYDFHYEDGSTVITSNITYNNDTSNSEKSYYNITPLEFNDKKYFSVIVSDNNHKPISKILYESLDKEINYSNIFSLLDLDFCGYISLNSHIRPSNFQITMPLFNTGNLIYINYSSSLNINYYYDSDERILKFESPDNIVYYMYETIDNQQYYVYCLNKKTDGTYTFEKFKDYLVNNQIYQRELISSKEISTEEYQKQYNLFNKYFEQNNIIIQFLRDSLN